MKNIEFELSRARFKNNQSWAFALFCTTVIIRFPSANISAFFGALATEILYIYILALVFVFMTFALYYSYKIKKLEKNYKER